MDDLKPRKMKEYLRKKIELKTENNEEIKVAILLLTGICFSINQ
jgi:hypothetical protein